MMMMMTILMMTDEKTRIEDFERCLSESRTQHGHLTGTMMMLEVYRKTDCKTGTAHRFVRACAVETHMDRVQYKSHFVWKFTGKTTGDTSGDTSGDTRFVRACAVKMHMDISQEPMLFGHVQGNWPDTRWPPPRLNTGP